MKKDLLTIQDLKVEEIEHIFELTEQMKSKANDFSKSLSKKCLGLIFLKPSLRTRVSFEAGMAHLGGSTFYLPPEDIKFGTRESLSDIGNVLSRYLDVIAIRTFSHDELQKFAGFCSIPVINGLTDLLHPCQALSDLYTIKEKRGSLDGAKIAFVGDGNNVAHSLLYGCAKLGVTLSIATPEGYKPKPEIVTQAQEIAQKKGVKLQITNNPSEAVESADVLYTDVWTSMGHEAECKKRTQIFKNFQINQQLLSKAKPECLVMHCLPAHRGEEITDEVIDGVQSVVFDQAENRMHVQKAILLLLVGGHE